MCSPDHYGPLQSPVHFVRHTTQRHEYSLPDWLVDRWIAELGRSETRSLAAALNQPAPLTIRVNTLLCTRDELARRLAQEGHETRPTRFSPDGLLRRHDYTVDVLDGSTGLNYAFDFRDVGGIKIPMKRRVYAYDGDYEKVPEPLLVAIDVRTATFE